VSGVDEEHEPVVVLVGFVPACGRWPGLRRSCRPAPGTRGGCADRGLPGRTRHRPLLSWIVPCPVCGLTPVPRDFRIARGRAAPTAPRSWIKSSWSRCLTRSSTWCSTGRTRSRARPRRPNGPRSEGSIEHRQEHRLDGHRGRPSALLSHTPGSVAQCSASTRGRCSAATRAQLNSDQPPGRPAYRQSGT